MTERPILMSAPMVRAILAGTKTQTRRVVKPVGADDGFVLQDYGTGWWPYRSDDGESSMKDGNEIPHACPYGEPGDRLWVREAWRTADTLDKMSPGAIGDASLNAGYSRPWAPLQFEADNRRNGAWAGFGPGGCTVVGSGKLRPGIHMPRWASRITLEVTGIRVERLQDISEADAKSEGCDPLTWSGVPGTAADLIDWPLKTVERPYANSYAVLWESINGPGSWAANPWVWCVEFRRTDR